MKQLTQQLKSGKMEILDVPFPALNKGYIMIRNHYSVISAGTEGKTVTDARKGYIAKAKSRQKEVKQVIEMVKTNGLLHTYKLVMNKLEAPASLGYSTAGEIIAVGEGVTNFKVGDWVACGGVGAFHADVVTVPVNLAVKVPKTVDLKQAAFSTIASIAIQGIRQADLRMGENCLIIGMGIIGQITCKILDVSGMNPVGVDVSEDSVKQSKDAGIKNVYNRNQEGIDEIIMNFTNGYGADAIIITAGTSSLDPVEFAGAMARKKAKVVIVGAVPTGFSRMHYYKKELDLKMSSSYGPGRSDMSYEEKGIDYPIGYVRWTENRNMQSYIDLLATNRLNIEQLISHTFSLKEAPKAYDMILARQEPFAGVVIQYNDQKTLKKDVALKQVSINPSDPNVGLIGAGNFAQNMLLPRMKGFCNFISLATIQGNESVYVGKKYGFANTYSDADNVISDEKVNTLFIITRHNTHAEFILKGIKANKHVYTEKPMAMNEAELEEIRMLWEKSNHKHLMIGFNRRFSPAVKKIKNLFLDEQPKTINIRVNAGIMPSNHWINDPEIGGGRIIGEACHFIDLAMYLAGAKIISVSATTMNDSNNLNNSIVINLKFANGSIASVNYFSNGNKNLSKEFIEVFCGGTVAQIDDFKILTIFGKSVKKTKFKGQDKGHSAEMQLFLNSIREGKPCPIPFEESYLSTLATFKVLESIKTGRIIHL
jgi:polar amino acid transport system substrate-binding protein